MATNYLRPCPEIIRNYKEIISSRAILRIENSFLEHSQSIILSERIESAVNSIENFLGVKLDTEPYTENKIIVNLFEKLCISHAKGSYSRPSHPHVFLSLNKLDNKEPCLSSEMVL